MLNDHDNEDLFNAPITRETFVGGTYVSEFHGEIEIMPSAAESEGGSSKFVVLKTDNFIWGADALHDLAAFLHRVADAIE